MIGHITQLLFADKGEGCFEVEHACQTLLSIQVRLYHRLVEIENVLQYATLANKSSLKGRLPIGVGSRLFYG